MKLYANSSFLTSHLLFSLYLADRQFNTPLTLLKYPVCMPINVLTNPYCTNRPNHTIPFHTVQTSVISYQVIHCKGSHLMPTTSTYMIDSTRLMSIPVISVFILLNINTFHIVSITCILNTLHIWIIDTIREFICSYDVVIGVLFMAFWLLVMAESLFFITLFWCIFHSSCSYIVSYECLYLPCVNTVSFTNSIVLSNSGLSLGCVYISRVLNILNIYHIGMCLVLSLTFTVIQIKEFHNISLYINESIYSSVFYLVTGLHFSHVVVGIILLHIMLWYYYYIKFVYIE